MIVWAFVAFFSLSSLSACKVSVNSGSSFGKMKPSENIVAKEFQVQAFDAVDVSAVAHVKFVQGEADRYRVKISAPDNYIPLFKVESSKNELDIAFVRKNTNIEAKNVYVTIYAPTLRKIGNSGVAEVRIPELVTQTLTVENSGVGSMTIHRLKAQAVDVECSGVGNVILDGTVEGAKLDCSGVGSISAEKLNAKSVKADVSGVGGIKCCALESIKGDVSGVGSLHYAGEPKHKELQRSGVGRISKL